MFRWIIIALLAAILVALGSALAFLVQDRGHGRRVLNALTVRVSLSVLLIITLLIGYWMGWIHPHLP